MAKSAGFRHDTVLTPFVQFVSVCSIEHAMERIKIRGAFAGCLLATFLLSLFTVSAQAEGTNSWIKPTSGNWDDPSAWSVGVLPSSSQSMLLTNSGWKAVAINPS